MQVTPKPPGFNCLSVSRRNVFEAQIIQIIDLSLHFTCLQVGKHCSCKIGFWGFLFFLRLFIENGE